MAKYIYRNVGCRFKKSEIKGIDYKDLTILEESLSENKKIMPARVTGTSAKYQRQIVRAVRIARFLALLPYTDSHKE